MNKFKNILLIFTTTFLMVFFVSCANGNGTIDDSKKILVDKTATGSKAFTNYHLYDDKFQKIFYVNINTGTDSNNGLTRKSAFKSIKRAQEEVSKNNINMTKDIIVYIAPGEYYLDSSLTFVARDSGSNGKKIIYSKDGNGEVNIYGGRKATEWEDVGNGIYKTKLNSNEEVYSLFENNKRAVVARSPNAGHENVNDNYNNIKSVTTVGGRPTFTYNEEDYIKKFSGNVSCYIWPGGAGYNYNWWSHLIPVTNYDLDKCSIQLAADGNWKIVENNRYFLQGAKEFLDTEGEFFQDKTNNDLYYKPYGNINNANIIIPTIYSCIDMYSTFSDTYVKDIVFDGLSFRATKFSDRFGSNVGGFNDDLGVIKMSNSRNISVQNCTIENTGFTAVSLIKDTQNIIIFNNYINDTGSHGIYLEGHAPGMFGENADEGYVNKFNIVEGNIVENVGIYVGYSSGIYLMHSGDNKIINNKISKSIRNGIYMLGTGYAFMPNELYGIKLSWENHYDFLYTRNNLIKGNEISQVLLDGQDAGAFYSYGTGLGNIIDGNYIHDVHSGIPTGATMGIYLDDASDGVMITNNIVERVGPKDKEADGGWSFCLKGADITLKNNIASYGAKNEKYGAVYVCRSPEDWYQVDMKAMATTNISMTNNVFYEPEYVGDNKFMIYTLWATAGKAIDSHPRSNYFADTKTTDLSQRGLIKEVDNNVYFAGINNLFENIFLNDWSRWDKFDYSIWKDKYSLKYGFDVNSIIEDPQFEKNDKGEYIFKKNSPAKQIGVKDIVYVCSETNRDYIPQ